VPDADMVAAASPISISRPLWGNLVVVLGRELYRAWTGESLNQLYF
jgi:hypothetical protein